MKANRIAQSALITVLLMLASGPAMAVTSFMSLDSSASVSHKSFPNAAIVTPIAVVPASPAGTTAPTLQTLNDDSSNGAGGAAHLTVTGAGTGIANAAFPAGIRIDQTRGPILPGFTTTSREEITVDMYWDISDGWGPGPLIAYNAFVSNMTTIGVGDLARITGQFTHEIDENNIGGVGSFVADHSVTLNFAKTVKDGVSGTFALYDADTLMSTALGTPSSVEATHLYHISGTLTLYAQDPVETAGVELLDLQSLSTNNPLFDILPPGLDPRYYLTQGTGLIAGAPLIIPPNVPEPATVALVGLALAAGSTCLRRRRPGVAR